MQVERKQVPIRVRKELWNVEINSPFCSVVDQRPLLHAGRHVSGCVPDTTTQDIWMLVSVLTT